jgi:hypothetical protein
MGRRIGGGFWESGWISRRGSEKKISKNDGAKRYEWCCRAYVNKARFEKHKIKLDMDI